MPSQTLPMVSVFAWIPMNIYINSVPCTKGKQNKNCVFPIWPDSGMIDNSKFSCALGAPSPPCVDFYGGVPLGIAAEQVDEEFTRHYLIIELLVSFKVDKYVLRI